MPYFTQNIWVTVRIRIQVKCLIKMSHDDAAHTNCHIKDPSAAADVVRSGYT